MSLLISVGTCNEFCLEIVLNILNYLGLTPQGSCVEKQLGHSPAFVSNEQKEQ